jgi:hypothetical protein
LSIFDYYITNYLLLYIHSLNCEKIDDNVNKKFAWIHIGQLLDFNRPTATTSTNINETSTTLSPVIPTSNPIHHIRSIFDMDYLFVGVTPSLYWQGKKPFLIIENAQYIFQENSKEDGIYSIVRNYLNRLMTYQRKSLFFALQNIVIIDEIPTAAEDSHQMSTVDITNDELKKSEMEISNT